MFFKVFWICRAVVYSIFFKKISCLGYLGKPLYVKGLKNVSIGKKFRLYPNFRIEVGDGGYLNIGENLSCGQNLHLICFGNMEIGNNVLISSNVLITDVSHSYEQLDIPVISQTNIIDSVCIGDNSFLGKGVVIQPGVTLGKNVIVGSNSVVTKSFPDYCVLAGIPARIIKQYNFTTSQWELVDSE